MTTKPVPSFYDEFFEALSAYVDAHSVQTTTDNLDGTFTHTFTFKDYGRESVAGSPVDLSQHWKESTFGFHEVTPRPGVLGWIGRKLGIYTMGWIDKLVQPMQPPR